MYNLFILPPFAAQLILPPGTTAALAPPETLYFECFVSDHFLCEHYGYTNYPFTCCTRKELHGLKSGEQGKRNLLLIILSPKALCKQCMKFNYNHITNNVGMCEVYGCEFMVSEIEMYLIILTWFCFCLLCMIKDNVW